MSDEAGGARPAEAGDPVPGAVRLMTERPIEMPLAAAGGQTSMAEKLEEHPGAAVAAALAFLGLVVLLRRRGSRSG